MSDLTYDASSASASEREFGSERRPALGCILMASGEGRRFGGNKLLVSFGGEPLIARILSATDTELLAERIVVTRHEEIAALCQNSGIRTVLHALPFRSDTIRLGLEALEDAAPDGCMFCPCDQPLLTKTTVEAMAAAFLEQPNYIYQLAFGDAAGSPVIFPKAYFPALKHLPQGKGGSWLIRNLPQSKSDSHLTRNLSQVEIDSQPARSLPKYEKNSRPAGNLPKGKNDSQLTRSLSQGETIRLLSNSLSGQVIHIPASSSWELEDIDTREDLRRLENLI